MKTKQRGSDRFPVANEIFTDRVDERRYLAQFFAKLCATSYEPLEKPVLSFYGVGGGGKTTLLSKALAERQEEEGNSRSPVTLNCVLCDVDTNDFKPDMETMQFFGGPLRQWLMMSGIKLHQFDRLYLAWWDLTNPNHPPLKLEDRIDGLLSPAGQVADTLSSFVDVIGGISSGIQVGQLAKGVAGYFKAKKEDRKFRALFGGDALDFSKPKALQKFAPAILAVDIRAYLRQNPKKAFCLAIDGFERLQADAHGKADVATEDLQWSLKELFVRFAEADEQGHEPRAGMILLGREMLRWHEIYKQDADADIDWVDLVDSHILTALAEEDARYHLSKVIEWCQSHSESGGLGPRLAQHFEAILESANEDPGIPERRFHPFSLDLAVEMVAKGGERFRTEDLGSGGARQLSQRFLDQMRNIAPSRYKAYQVLALSLDFDKPLFDHLVQKGTLTGFAPHEFPLLVDADLSYIKPDDLHPGRYRFHRKMQEALVESFRGQYLDKASQVAAEIVGVMAEYFQSRMRDALNAHENDLAKEHYDRLVTMLLEHHSKGNLDWETAAKRIDQVEVGLDGYFNIPMRIAVHRRYLEWVESARGQHHPETATSLNNLAKLLKDQGDYAVAEPLCRRALAICEQALGLEHPDTATCLNLLGSLLWDQFDDEAAVPLLQRAFDINERVFGPNHPSTIKHLNILSLVNWKDDDIVERQHRHALNVMQRECGPNSLETADSLINLAWLLTAQERYDEPELLFFQVLRIREQALGTEHKLIADTLDDLVCFLEEKGESDRAVPLCRRALDIRERVLPPDDPDIVINIDRLASLLKAKGDSDAVEVLYRRALEFRERALGPEHPDTATSLNNLAALLKTQGDSVGAVYLFKRALAINEKALGPEHPDIATSLNNLALLLKRQGDNAGAEPLYRRALAIRELALGPDHPDTATSLNNLASLLDSQGDYAGAEPLCVSAIPKLV